MHAFQQQRQPARGVSEYGGEVSELYEGVWVYYCVRVEIGGIMLEEELEQER